MPYSTRNGVKTYYEVPAKGYPFVLMHANPFDRRMFLYQVAHLSTYFKVINIDLRGYGYSDKPAMPVTMTDLCEDVVAVCRQEGASEAIFAGVSVGGVMGLQLGFDHPEIFKALILVGCSSMPGDRYQSRIDGYMKQGVEKFHIQHLDRSGQQGFCPEPTGQISARHAHRNGFTLERAGHRRDFQRTAESRFDRAITRAENAGADHERRVRQFSQAQQRYEHANRRRGTSNDSRRRACLLLGRSGDLR